jgi:hypothetical protein
MFQMSHKALVCSIESLAHWFSKLKLVLDEILGPSLQSPLGSPIAAAQSLMDASVDESGFLQREYIFSAFFLRFF